MLVLFQAVLGYDSLQTSLGALLLFMCNVTHLVVEWCSSDASVYVYSMLQDTLFLAVSHSFCLSFLCDVQTLGSPTVQCQCPTRGLRGGSLAPTSLSGTHGSASLSLLSPM